MISTYTSEPDISYQCKMLLFLISIQLLSSKNSQWTSISTLFVSLSVKLEAGILTMTEKLSTPMGFRMFTPSNTHKHLPKKISK